MSGATKQAIQFFRQYQGLLRTAQALKLGITPRTLYALRDSGVIVQVSRGLTGWPIFLHLASPTWLLWR